LGGELFDGSKKFSFKLYSLKLKSAFWFVGDFWGINIALFLSWIIQLFIYSILKENN